jgi:hypothetical protein
MGQGHCVAAVDATNVLVGTSALDGRDPASTPGCRHRARQMQANPQLRLRVGNPDEIAPRFGRSRYRVNAARSA